MSEIRTRLIGRYEQRIVAKERELNDVNALLPDYDNLQDSEAAFQEKRLLLRSRRNLSHQIAELKSMVADLKTLNDDSTSA